MAGIKSLEVSLDDDGNVIDWTFDGGKRAETDADMAAAASAIEANFDFIQMARAAYLKAAKSPAKRSRKA